MAAFVAKWKPKCPKLKAWPGKTGNVLTFCDFPEGLGRLVYANNGIESFNKQIKRLAKKQIQFVTEEALEKRIVSMFLHCKTTTWARGKWDVGGKSLPITRRSD